MPDKNTVTETPSREDQKRRHARALEWKGFRRDYLYSQRALADALKCSRRTVVSVESGHEVLSPHADLLRRFNFLKLQQRRAAKRMEVEVACWNPTWK